MRRFFNPGLIFLIALSACSQSRVATLPPEVAAGEKAVQYPVHWIRNLPPAVKTAWKDCPYAGWMIFDIKKIVTPKQVSYSIHVAQMQSLGPDDADIGSEYILYFSEEGTLIAKEKLL